MSDHYDADYHLQRAQRERALAEQAASAQAQAAHRHLADLHEARLTHGDARPRQMIGASA